MYLHPFGYMLFSLFLQMWVKHSFKEMLGQSIVKEYKICNGNSLNSRQCVCLSNSYQEVSIDYNMRRVDGALQITGITRQHLRTLL